MMREELDSYDELVFHCEGEEVWRVALTSSLRASLGTAWDLLEQQLHRRMDVVEVVGELCRQTLARARG